MSKLLKIKFNYFFKDGFICDFETDFCGWYQTSDSTVNWARKTGKTYGGPKVDQ